MGSSFTAALANSLTPAYSLATVVQQFPEFQSLPEYVLAHSFPKGGNNPSYLLNVSIPEATMTMFNRIAVQILSLPSLPRSVSNIQLSPAAIISAIYPLQGNEAAIGLSLLSRPIERIAVINAINTVQLVVAGPYKQLQGTFNILGRLPLFSSTNGINTTSIEGLGGEEVPGQKFWGLTTVTINFNLLV
eukprot:CAMPEP_0113672566 /NCGR_PEP_ID=MMETSP0038_2-20120614/6344_1 /TAXON_ID=2898 /ORGANISM="Cryptomonas paramecium" /LENGTH=188 /DNA_ID=CAMNT_0000588869 /DNA_START=186 /DNA_END=749 /DNA_ORIENTATION=+ /assembly_acc=CAM_ASM_000170